MGNKIMKRITFWSFFGLMQISLIFLKIYQHNVYVNTIYQKQKHQVRIDNINVKINDVIQQMEVLKNKERNFQIAQSELKMKPLSIKQIHKIEA